MRKYIQKHLDENYYIKQSKSGNYGIYGINNKENKFQYPINSKKIITEISNIFGVDYDESKKEIIIWSKEIDFNFYWSHHNFPLPDMVVKQP